MDTQEYDNNKQRDTRSFYQNWAIINLWNIPMKRGVLGN